MTQILVDHSVIVVRKDRQLPSLTVVPWHLSRKRRLARQVVARCRRPALPKIAHQMKGKWVVKHPQIVAFLLGFPYFSDLFRYQVQICPNPTLNGRWTTKTRAQTLPRNWDRLKPQHPFASYFYKLDRGTSVHQAFWPIATCGVQLRCEVLQVQLPGISTGSYIESQPRRNPCSISISHRDLYIFINAYNMWGKKLGFPIFPKCEGVT